MRIPLVRVQSDADVLGAGRECGNCTACCVLPRIRPTGEGTLLAEGKAGYAQCDHLCAHGCMRYDDRPSVCRDFMCLWRSGHLAGDERRRPDRLGLMLTVEESSGQLVIEVWELWERAASDGPGRYLLDALAAHGVRLAVRYYGVPCSMTYRGPKSLLDGNEMSRSARDDPKALAAHLRMLCEERLVVVPDQRALMDFESLERGEPVAAHYRP